MNSFKEFRYHLKLTEFEKYR